MAKKHVNDDKPRGYGGRSVSGDKGGSSSGKNTADNRGGGERNVGKQGSEEHSRNPKGNRG